MPLQEIYKLFFKNSRKENFQQAINITLSVFPISTIATTMDLFCYLQRYIPIDDNNSIIETDIFIPKIFTNNQNKTNFIIESAKI